ncbi:MAG: hypothetical protein LBU97_05200, partial [Alistipes sp.]|nr:hypothetical protein [Alistipes sp.]
MFTRFFAIAAFALTPTILFAAEPAAESAATPESNSKIAITDQRSRVVGDELAIDFDIHASDIF